MQMTRPDIARRTHQTLDTGKIGCSNSSSISSIPETALQDIEITGMKLSCNLFDRC